MPAAVTADKAQRSEKNGSVGLIPCNTTSFGFLTAGKSSRTLHRKREAILARDGESRPAALSHRSEALRSAQCTTRLFARCGNIEESSSPCCQRERMKFHTSTKPLDGLGH